MRPLLRRAATSIVVAAVAALAGCSDDDSVGRGLDEDGTGGTFAAAGAGGSDDGGDGPAAGSGGDGGSGNSAGVGGGCPGGATCVDALPFHDQRDTGAEGSKLIDVYACKPEADESGPEIAYLVQVPSAGTLTVAVTDGDGVDIDVHILEGLDGASCLARDDVTASTAVPAGAVWVIADTYVAGGVPQFGSFELDITLE